MAAHDAPHRRSAWLVVKAMAAEIARQHGEGTIAHAAPMDESAHINLAGSLDLARLADVTERALRGAFGL